MCGRYELHANPAAIALAMVVVVALVMTAYVMLDRRTSKWMPR